MELGSGQLLEAKGLLGTDRERYRTLSVELHLQYRLVRSPTLCHPAYHSAAIGNGSNYAANEEIAINLAQQIAVNSGSASYDIQIVPYCPFVDTYLNDFSLYSKEPIKDGNDNVIGYYFWAERSSGSFKKSESRSELSLSGSDYTYKELTQLTQYILCSPDKQSQWLPHRLSLLVVVKSPFRL